jgi:hypothetical protein
MKELPPDFDWVTARRDCSAAKVFELLSLQTIANVESMKTHTEGRVIQVFEYARIDGSFSVVNRAGKGVRFDLVGQEIHVETSSGDVQLSATLTLNDKGECRLLVGSEPLDRWQFLRRALEPLFFPVGR